MIDPAARKTPHYDPSNFKVPEFRKDKDGSLDPTHYQAAVALKDFMRRNNALFVSADQLWEANNKGTVTLGDNVVQLNDQEKAMFKKLSHSLFDRLDGGTNSTHDGLVGIQDIDDAIRQSWKLHGPEKSPDGKWKEPMSDSTMTRPEAKQALQGWMKDAKSGKYGFEDPNNAFINRHIISEITLHHKFHGTTVDPRQIEAMYLIKHHFDVIDANQDMLITPDEVDNWQV